MVLNASTHKGSADYYFKSKFLMYDIYWIIYTKSRFRCSCYILIYPAAVADSATVPRPWDGA